MNAIHILSTAPSCRAGKKYSPMFFEVESFVLSALLWKKFNGPIKLYTDEAGRDFVISHSLDSLWDSMDIDTLADIPSDIDQRVFWAGSKLFALKAEKCPVAMVDTDLFVWKDINPICVDKTLVTLHREEFIDCYPPKSELTTAPGYSFQDWMDWTVKPCNTAFAFFSDESLKSFYFQEAVRFMTGNDQPSVYVNSQMVFAEQRLLAMCAKHMGVDVFTLVEDPFDRNNDIFTHLWGAKRIARKDKRQREKLENALLSKIRGLSEDYYNQLLSLLPMENLPPNPCGSKPIDW